MTFSRTISWAALLACVFPVSALVPSPILTPQAPIIVPGGPGGFDWMAVDAQRHRLLAAHPGKGTLVVYDLKSKSLQQLDTDGKVNGEAVDPVDSKLFVAGGNQKVVVFDLKTLAKISEIPVTGPADSIEFDPKNDTLYVDHDDGTEVWTINGKSEKVTGSVKIQDAPEALAYDPKSDRLYQNIKPANCTQVINPATNTVEATWPTAPMTSPHGIALDASTHHLFAAGEGKVDMMDMQSGKVLATVDIAPGYVDQIAFDPANKCVYCASKVGTVSVVQENGDSASLVASIPVPQGTHTLAIDPHTHDVWISYADKDNSYIEKLAAAK